MKLNELKLELQLMNKVEFVLENGNSVPAHFHVTEIGLIDKKFIDCGGTLRNESKIQFQLWDSYDYHHRLTAEKFLKIIQLSEDKLNLTDLEVEVEFQGDTIGRYQLSKKQDKFLLKSTSTACLAKEGCIVSDVKNVVHTIQDKVGSCCGANTGCC